MALSEREQAILDFERTCWKDDGPKEAGIRQRFDLSPTRYYQLLNELLESADALEYDPLVVRRLRRGATGGRRGAREGDLAPEALSWSEWPKRLHPDPARVRRTGEETCPTDADQEGLACVTS